MKRILLVTGIISNYRVPVYNIIGKKFDFTIAYDVRDESEETVGFSKIKLDTFSIGPIKLIRNNLYKLMKQYDVVVILPDMHYINLAFLPFIKGNIKMISWSIGMRASYTRLFDLNRKKTFLDWVYFKILDNCNASIFYMKEVMAFNEPYGLKKEKCFVAHNTVAVLPLKADVKKDSIIFVGTLYPQKKIYELLKSYLAAYQVCQDMPMLLIVGDGSEFNSIKSIIKEKGVENKIKLLGRIIDEELLRDMFLRSFVCVSPGQAGLTVLKSFGYGVPFVTRKDAVTGGELLNVDNNITGILYDNDEMLVDILKDVKNNPRKYIEMGACAYNYYCEKATPEKMAQGVIDAIEYVLID